jgi:hypothetical protein
MQPHQQRCEASTPSPAVLPVRHTHVKHVLLRFPESSSLPCRTYLLWSLTRSSVVPETSVPTLALALPISTRWFPYESRFACSANVDLLPTSSPRLAQGCPEDTLTPETIKDGYKESARNLGITEDDERNLTFTTSIRWGKEGAATVHQVRPGRPLAHPAACLLPTSHLPTPTTRPHVKLHTHTSWSRRAAAWTSSDQPPCCVAAAARQAGGGPCRPQE